MPLPNLAKLKSSAKVFNPSHRATQSYYDFCYQCTRIVEPIIYLCTKFDWLENASITAANVLKKLDADSATSPEGDVMEVGHFREFKRRFPVLAQNSIVSLVDAFETYVFDLIVEILSKNPRMLPLKKTISIEEALNSDDLSTLINRQIMRRARELSYLSFQDKVRTLRNEYSFDIVDDDVQVVLSRLVALRNCFVHNRGQLDEKACGLIGSGAQVGMTIVVGGEEVFDVAALLNVVGEDIDFRAAQKFKLSSFTKESVPSGSIGLRDAVGLPSL